MLFEPPIDELAKIAGCRYAVAVIVGSGYCSSQKDKQLSKPCFPLSKA